MKKAREHRAFCNVIVFAKYIANLSPVIILDWVLNFKDQ